MLFSLRFKPILLNSDAVELNFGVVESNSVELLLNSVDVRLNSIDIESANRWKYYAEPSNLIFSWLFEAIWSITTNLNESY